MSSRLEEIRNQKIEKLSKIKDEFYDPYEIEKYNADMSVKEFRDKYNKLEKEENSDEKQKFRGRLISIRGHGKLMFADLKGESGIVQIVFRKDNIENFRLVKLLGVGDIIGVQGSAMRTRAGELSLVAENFLILSKNIMPLPNKWQGLKDAETKYRKRYVDFIIDDSSKEAIVKRSRIIREMRHYLDDKGFLEVETPILHSLLGGANAKPFKTHHNSLDIELYLRVAPELYLKRLSVAGFNKIYEIGKNFRNEGIDYKHNPEFTSMELYWTYVDYEDIMTLTENLIHNVVVSVAGSEVIEYEGKKIDFKLPFKRVSMSDAVKDATGIDFDKIDDKEAMELARKHNIELPYDMSKGKILTEFFDKYVEDNLINPVFITKHPVETSPLAKRDPKNKAYTNRFELFINGWELANAFSELNDPFDQYERFKHQMELKDLGDSEANDMDYDFIEALEIGLPPTGGLGIGIDRLAMLVCSKHNIRDVIAFPLLRPQKGTLERVLKGEYEEEDEDEQD